MELRHSFALFSTVCLTVIDEISGRSVIYVTCTNQIVWGLIPAQRA